MFKQNTGESIMSTFYVELKKIKALTLLFAAAGMLVACGSKQNQDAATTTAAAPPPSYPVFKVIQRSAILQTDYPATLQGEQNIEIRPKIDGYVEKIYVDEGQAVKKGQLLFRINAPQYLQDLNNAAAAVSSAEADVNTAELQVKKTKPLVDQDIISRYELESAENALKTRKAVLAQARANLANAKTNLGYVTIVSPVDGVIGTLPYKLGSLVSGTTTQPLTTVSNISHVYAYFSMNEKQLLDFSRQYQGSTLQAKLKQLPPVTLLLSDGTEYPEKGKVESIGGLISTQTGSVSFRATFPNPVGLLRSGASATVQIPVTVENAILVPQRSTYELQGKKFVYRVDTGNKVISNEIEVMKLSAGQYFVVTKGLQPGNTILFESTSALQDSTIIKPELLPENKVYSKLK
jgi:membrane fusion protein, multidrug efflux system